jgi:hypothetical protein
MSKADTRHGRAGTRVYYWPKDLQVKSVPAHPDRPLSLQTMSDVDFHLDMARELVLSDGPTVIYTITPETAARNDGEVSFCFKRVGEQHQLCWATGGADAYEHEIWDYRHDNITVTTAPWSPLEWFRWLRHGEDVYVKFPEMERPAWGARAYYLVDRKRVAQDRSVILFTLVRKFSGLAAFRAKRSGIESHELERFKPIQNINGEDYVVFDVINPTGHSTPRLRTIAKAGHYACATLPADAVDDAMLVVGRNEKSALSTMTHLAARETPDPEQRRTNLNIIHSYAVATGAKQLNKAAVLLGTPLVRNYSWVASGEFLGDEVAKPSMKMIAQPVVAGAWIPLHSKGNVERAVEKRVIEVREDKPPKPSAQVLKRVRAFLEFLIPPEVAGTGIPAPASELWDKQSRPTQQHILRTGSEPFHVDSPNIHPMMKPESYGKDGDTRGIYPIQPGEKVAFSPYVMGLAEHVKKFPWYAFGRPPVEIAERVASVAQEAETLLGSDASRMDGRWTEAAWNFIRQVLIRFYGREEGVAAVNLLNKLLNRKAKFWARTSLEPVVFRTLQMMLSGQPGTSLFNTLLNALINFLALMLDGFTAEEAWLRLGIYGGDDGLSADVTPESLVYAGRYFGQIMKVDVWNRHEPLSKPVEFLARHYTNEVWAGNPNSTCDLRRQIVKLNLSVGAPKIWGPEPDHIDFDEVRMTEKALSYALTDSNTPIIGEYVGRILELAGTSNAAPQTRWWDQYDSSVQFPNHPNAWLDSYNSHVLSQLGIDDAERKLLSQRLKDCKSVAEVIRLPPIGALEHECSDGCHGDLEINGVLCCGGWATQRPPNAGAGDVCEDSEDSSSSDADGSDSERDLGKSESTTATELSEGSAASEDAPDVCRERHGGSSAGRGDVVTDRGPVPCGQCKRRFATERALRQHVDAKHSEPAPRATSRGRRPRGRSAKKPQGPRGGPRGRNRRPPKVVLRTDRGAARDER